MSNDTTPEQYLEMWLSEQIPIKDWLEILKERSDVHDLYKKHLEKPSDTGTIDGRQL